MNLVGHTGVVTTYDFDEETGEATIKFFAIDGVTELGEMIVDRARVRPLFDSLATAGRAFFRDTDTTVQRHSTSIDVNEKTVRTLFK